MAAGDKKKKVVPAFQHGLPMRFVEQDNADYALVVALGGAGSGSTSEGAGTAAAPFVSGGTIKSIEASFTRPADTTAYTAKDVVSNSTSTPSVITFTNMGRANGIGGEIIRARLFTDQSTNVARFRLHLFITSPTAINDNAPYTLLWANRTKRIGFIDFPACNTEGSGSDSANSLASAGVGNLPLGFDCDDASRNLLGMLETLDAFTPASAQNFFIDLLVAQAAA